MSLLADGHPELRLLAEGSGAGAGSGQFVHLDLSRARVGERRGVEEVVGWMVRRCMGRPSAAPFLVLYLESGEEEQGRLVLAGRPGAVSDDRACAALSEALLGLYGELTAGARALA